MSNFFIDTHMHITGYVDNISSDTLFNDMINNNVLKGVCISTCKDDWKINYDFSLKYSDNIDIALGIHPLFVNNDECQINKMIEFYYECNDNKICAIGEIGLDTYRDSSNLNIQINKFIQQIDFAKKINKPIILHIRGDLAAKESLEILKTEAKGYKLLFHCYSSSDILDDFIINRNETFIGISGTITYSKSNHKTIELLRHIDKNKILTETDAPYLMPNISLKSGKINYPKNVVYIAQYISKILDMEIEKFNEQIYINYCNLFMNKLN